MTERFDPSEDRMPMPHPDALSPAQRSAVDRIRNGPRGEIVGPFVPLLRSPELMTRIQLVGEFIRFDSELDDALIEVAILCVARYWDQQFEWGYHLPIAISKGVAAQTIEAIAAHAPPDDPDPDVGIVWTVVDELLHTRRLSAPSFARARTALGEAQLIELVATVGYYSTLAMVMNAAGTPPPVDAPRLPQAPSP